MRPWKLLCAAMTFAGLGVGSSVHATPLTWTLNNAVFTDGGTATGSYIYDADTNSISNINIVTSAASPFGGSLTYGFVAFLPPQFVVAYENSGPPYTGTLALVLALVSPMTNLGGTIPFDLAAQPIAPYEGVCWDTECVGINPFRYFTSGSVTALAPAETPLPAALPLFVTGLAGIGVIAHRHRRKQSA